LREGENASGRVGVGIGWCGRRGGCGEVIVVVAAFVIEDGGAVEDRRRDWKDG